MQRLRERARAEEVLQDAYVEIWHKVGTYSPSLSKPMTWLMMIVNNRAIDEVRRRAREDRVRVFEDEDTANRRYESHQDSGSMHGFRDYFGSDVIARLETCLKGLTGDQRKAIMDIRVNGMTIEETAARYGVPRQTAAAWLRRGIQRLAECMQR
jgi:RNA polymerase sigma-70 factor (ECF subfamily)